MLTNETPILSLVDPDYTPTVAAEYLDEKGKPRVLYGYQKAMGLIDALVEVARSSEVCLLKEVLRHAVSDMAGNEWEDDPLHAHDFLFGREGRLYCDALGIDCELMRNQIVRLMPNEMARAMKLRAEAERLERANLELSRIEEAFLDELMDKPSTLKGVAKALGVTQSTVRRLVRRMMDKGYVQIEEGLQPSKLAINDQIWMAKTRKAA